MSSHFALRLPPWRNHSNYWQPAPCVLPPPIIVACCSVDCRYRQRPRHEIDATDDRLVEHQRLVAALRRLPVEVRTAVVLRYCEDLTEQDAAAVMGVAVGTVKSRTARGLARLRGLLEEDDDA